MNSTQVVNQSYQEQQYCLHQRYRKLGTTAVYFHNKYYFKLEPHSIISYPELEPATLLSEPTHTLNLKL